MGKLLKPGVTCDGRTAHGQKLLKLCEIGIHDRFLGRKQGDITVAVQSKSIRYPNTMPGEEYQRSSVQVIPHSRIVIDRDLAGTVDRKPEF